MTEETFAPEDVFAEAMEYARRSALRIWIFRAALRGATIAAVLATIAIWWHLQPGNAATLCVTTAAITIAASLWQTRRTFSRFADALDERCNADGRISGAAEFVVDASDDPFKRLAVAEAGAWLARHPDKLRACQWPAEVYTAAASIVLLGIAYRWA